MRVSSQANPKKEKKKKNNPEHQTLKIAIVFYLTLGMSISAWVITYTTILLLISSFIFLLFSFIQHTQVSLHSWLVHGGMDVLKSVSLCDLHSIRRQQGWQLHGYSGPTFQGRKVEVLGSGFRARISLDSASAWESQNERQPREPLTCTLA